MPEPEYYFSRPPADTKGGGRILFALALIIGAVIVYPLLFLGLAVLGFAVLIVHEVRQSRNRDAGVALDDLTEADLSSDRPIILSPAQAAKFRQILEELDTDA